MLSDRLCEVEEHLEILREQRKSLEREILLTTGLPKTQAEQRLRLDLKPNLRKYEEEYWQILVERSAIIKVADSEAENVVLELVERIEPLQHNPQYPSEILGLLQKIYAKVCQPEVTASAKLKGALSLLPPFVNLSYEAEIDTENFLRTHFPTFRGWAKTLAKK
jgi:hypothetical protein